MGTAIIMALEILYIILFIYCLYKLIWYICKMTALDLSMKRLKKKGFPVVRLRGGFGRVFGKRGEVDYRIITPAAVFEVSVISFISNHSRWNIESEYIMEENRERHCIDVRRYNKIFYRIERHAEHPDHALDFRRETRISRTRLELAPRDENMRPQDRKILLFYPKPQALTRTQTGLKYLYPGDRIGDYEVMYLDSLRSALEEASKSAEGH